MPEVNTRVVGVKGQIQERGVQRRRAIVEAATELFARDGFRGTGLAAIADEVGVTPAAVLHHFGSKQNLLLAVLRERDRRVVSFVGEFPQPGRAGFEAWIRAAEWNETQWALTSLYTVLECENLLAEHPAHEFFISRTASVREGIVQTIESGIRRGEFRADIDVGAKADEILAFVEGAHMVWLQDPERISLSGLFRSYFGSLLDQLAAEPTHAS